jgi:hypothetical protein
MQAVIHGEERRRSYSPEAMLDTTLQLYDAVRAYVPRPYAGHAALLLSRKQARQLGAGKTSFWRDYLADFDCYALEDAHHLELFDQRLGDTASFVRTALESDKLPATWRMIEAWQAAQ